MAMAAGNYSIPIKQGSTYSEIWTFKDSAGDAIDLTGYAFRGDIKRKIGTELLASFTYTILDQTSPSTKGKVRVYMSATTTAAIAVKSGLSGNDRITEFAYDMELIPSGGEPDRFAEGVVLFSAEVTTSE